LIASKPRGTAGREEIVMTRTMLLGALAAVTIATITANARELDTGCYARVYDSAHLAKHPDQLITAVELCLHPGDGGAPDFTLEIKRRGDIKALHALGPCRSGREGSTRGLSCNVESDGGGVYVEFPSPAGDYVLMYLERIRMQEYGKEADDETGTEVTAGKDDKVFRLDRVR
jgi:hypothetical protein